MRPRPLPLPLPVADRRTRVGFTILELIVSLTVLGAVVGAATMTLVGVQRQYTTQRSTTESQETIRGVEMVLQRAFRTARVNPRNAAPANVALVVNPLGRAGNWNNVEIRGDFNPIDGTVNGDWEDTRVELTGDTVYVRYKKGVAKEPVAYPVSALRFQFYDIAGTELTTTATASAGARRVKVTISVPVPRTTKTIQRELWIFLRN